MEWCLTAVFCAEQFGSSITAAAAAQADQGAAAAIAGAFNEISQRTFAILQTGNTCVFPPFNYRSSLCLRHDVNVWFYVYV